jgi:hypothetical protein
MLEFLLYVGSFSGSGLCLTLAYWGVIRAIAAENARVFEEWERI